MKTYSPRLAEVGHDWYLVDAKGQTLGRLATQIATYLMGKHKPQYAAHIDCGDNIVVINAAEVGVTGNKLENKKYYHHSGYPGGIKEVTLADQLIRKPERVIEHAVAGMLPKNRLHDDRMARLRIFAGAEHSHAGQTPKLLILGEANNG